jgi:hypothetical protein
LVVTWYVSGNSGLFVVRLRTSGSDLNLIICFLKVCSQPY